MLEKPTGDSSNVKRYAPPNQRNRLGRRKSGAAGEKLERASSYANEGDKAQAAGSRNFPSVDRRDASSSVLVNESAPARLISLHGCCESEAFRLLNDRWAATMDAYNNPSIDAGERPVMYSGNGASAWGHFRLPHQMDFLNELKRAMWKANGSSNT
ncbi:Esterase [Heracleum sosnowskyi]|uniref:Esterase n=1 Tax=Heracleum sosnowskyi TaxID=360622 RepID=A0AAD8J594_9APIA|nr:Esterase [Heracleum sosnowskyi]